MDQWQTNRIDPARSTLVPTPPWYSSLVPKCNNHSNKSPDGTPNQAEVKKKKNKTSVDVKEFGDFFPGCDLLVFHGSVSGLWFMAWTKYVRMDDGVWGMED